MIKLLIVDDHHLVRTGLKNIVADAGGIEVVGEAGSGERAIQLNRELEPDVILMDIGLPGLSGFETTERIMNARPSVRVIALTARTQAPFPARLLDMGAAGFLTKACEAAELVAAIRKVHDGERYIGSEIAQQLAMALLPGTPRSVIAAAVSRANWVRLSASSAALRFVMSRWMDRNRSRPEGSSIGVIDRSSQYSWPSLP